jgi:pSer/pThr/pTyr-binding forkhead associated (FHA) protein
MQVRLKVLNGKSAGRELKIPYEEFLIGRNEECHLRPKSESISRRHCVIRVREGKVFIEDLGSKNGTFVAEQATVGEVEVVNGALLRIGRLEVQLIIEHADARKSDTDVATTPLVADESWAEDNDITKWLEESPAAAAGSAADPETQQFRLDETERAALETSAEQAATPTSVPAEADAEGKATDKEKEKEKKKPPGKLPPRAFVTGASSREAAADMLKRFFNRP